MPTEITDIDLFDLNVGMACANVRLRERVLYSITFVQHLLLTISPTM